ncbi:hypothetical protein IJ596_00365 [bacterium]|nr:hypothetical protein [bacterium]
MMNGKIDAIQQQYMYTVQPVKLFDDEKQKTKQSSFEVYPNTNFWVNKANIDNNIYPQMNKSDYNPFHPNVKSGTVAKNLDLMC